MESRPEIVKMNVPSRSSRVTVLLAVLSTLALVGLGFAVSRGLAEDLLVGGGVLLAAVVLSAVSPAAGVSGVLLAAPTMYDLYPMPRGTFSLLELAILTATAGIALRLLLDGWRNGWKTLSALFVPAQVVVPIVLLLGAAALTIVTLAEPVYRAETLREIRTVIIEPLLFFAVARMAMRQYAVRAFAGSALIVAGVSVAIYAVVQILMDTGGVQAGDLTRATATYTHPNNLALFLERTLLLTIGIGIVRPKWWPVWIVAVIQLAGVALTLSRGALIALVAGVAIILLLRKLHLWLLLLAAGGIGAAGVGIVLFPDRFIDAGGSGAEPTRMTIWRASLRMAMDHPIFGVGPDQFLYQYQRRYIEPIGWPERWTSHPHNLLLDTWLRLGIAGLAALTSLGVGIAWWIKRHIRVIRDDTWSMGAIAALVGGIAHGMLDNGFFLPDLATLTWFFIALLVTVPGSSLPSTETAQPDSHPAMERTWPGFRMGEGRPSGVVFSISHVTPPRWAVPVMALAFVLAPLVSHSVYLPLLMIALAGLVTILHPAVGLAGVVASIPVQDAILIPFVRGELTYTQVVLAGAVLGWAVTINRYRIWLDSVVVGFVTVFAALSISLVEMDSQGLWAGEAYRWAVAGLFYLLCRSVLTSWDRIKVVLYGFMAGVLGASAYTVYEIVDWVSLSDAGGLLTFRALGTFGVPNPLAAYFELTVPLLVVLALMGFRASIRETLGLPFWLLAMLSSVGGLVTLLLTQSRGGYIGMAVALMLLVRILPRRLQIAGVATAGLLAIVFLLTPVGQTQIERFSSAVEESEGIPGASHQGTWGREALWLAGFDMLLDKPLTGVGAGEFDYHYREYVREWVDRPPAGQAHNGWLQMGAQAGFPGLIAFTIWLGAALHSVFSAYRRATDPMARLLAWGAASVLIAFTLHSLVDYLNGLSLGLQVSAVIAIGLNVAPSPLSVYGDVSKKQQPHDPANAMVVPAQ
jgi:putative inorganic carbon (HCO3(-)) transporter